MGLPLEGLVVVDLTRVLAGPFCTMMLADLGAEVLKIERPKTGDDARAFSPFAGGESAYFMSVNRGKKSATLNLQHPRGAELLRRLARRADVLVENFKPGVMKKLSLDYEALARENPRLIYAASSGFGQSGPYSHLPAYDLIIQGMGGMMSITGPDAETPTKVGSSIADIFAGVFTVVGILAALHTRERTGRGQAVDVAMLDCMVAVLESALARFFASGVSPVPVGNRHPSIAPFCTLRTADGAINIACGNDELWRRFCELVGLPELVTDPRAAENRARVENWMELEPTVLAAMKHRTTGEWMATLRDAGVPCGPILNMAEIAVDPHVLARQMLVEVVHPVAGRLRVPGVPIKLSETPGAVRGPAPLLGQHNEEIWGSVGVLPEELGALQREGVL